MIDAYIDDIKRSLENGCYYAALSLAVTLPDICGRAEYPKKEVGERYIKWCDEYLCPSILGKVDGISGEAVYNFRNTFLHQGEPSINSDAFKNDENRIDKLILLVGEIKGPTEMSCEFKSGDINLIRVIAINSAHFCECICDAVQDYYHNNKSKFSLNYDIMHTSEFKSADQDAENEENISDEELFKALVNNPGFIEFVKEKRRFFGKISDALSERIDTVTDYFAKSFDKPEYLEKKDEIIKAVLLSKTKEEVKDNIKKLYNSKNTKTVMYKLNHLLEELNYPEGK